MVPHNLTVLFTIGISLYFLYIAKVLYDTSTASDNTLNDCPYFSAIFLDVFIRVNYNFFYQSIQLQLEFYLLWWIVAKHASLQLVAFIGLARIGRIWFCTLSVSFQNAMHIWNVEDICIAEE